MHEWDCETNGCKFKDGYCVMCQMSADGTHTKPVTKRAQPRDGSVKQ
jgi:hypothetical protein